MHHQTDHHQVGEHLQQRLQTVLIPQREQENVKQRERIPKQDSTEEKTHRQTRWRQLHHGQLNSEQKRQDQNSYFNQPGQPVALVEGRLHFSPEEFENIRRAAALCRLTLNLL